MTTAITSFWLELGNNIPIIRFHKRKSRISRDKSRFRNSIGIYGKSFRPVIGCFSCYATREPRATLWDVFGGKTFVAYIFPLAAFCAFCLGYFISYTRNTDFGYRTHALLNFIMYAFWRSWASCKWASYPIAILHTLAYFPLNSCHWVTKSHDKYQSMILIGLALAEKAYVGFRCFLLHYRSYWEEWRPLVTPWARCIKEGIEPWTAQKWSFTSHAQVRFLLFSLSLLLSCFTLIIIIVILVFYMNMYLPRVYNGNKNENKPGHYYSKIFPFAKSLSLSFLLSLSLSSA